MRALSAVTIRWMVGRCRDERGVWWARRLGDWRGDGR